jgi:hypothetical protein
MARAPLGLVVMTSVPVTTGGGLSKAPRAKKIPAAAITSSATAAAIAFGCRQIGVGGWKAGGNDGAGSAGVAQGGENDGTGIDGDAEAVAAGAGDRFGVTDSANDWTSGGTCRGAEDLSETE